MIQDEASSMPSLQTLDCVDICWDHAHHSRPWCDTLGKTQAGEINIFFIKRALENHYPVII